jgi:hypothetical protein
MKQTASQVEIPSDEMSTNQNCTKNCRSEKCKEPGTYHFKQGCGSRFNDFLDPHSESGSRIRIQGQENDVQTTYIFVHFSLFFNKRFVGDPDPHYIPIQ